MRHGRPGAFDPFAAVEGIFSGNAFAPAVNPFRVNGDQQNAATVGTAKARLEKMNERHTDFAEGDGFYFHGQEQHFTTESQRHRENL